MSKKGSHLTQESKDRIGAANRRRGEKRAQLELIMRKDRLFVRGLGNNAISVEVDVTPVWHFFKEVMQHSATKGSAPITLKEQ